MTAIFEFPLQSEMLSPNEVTEITGCSRRADQMQWLNRNHWAFHTAKSGEPIIGRMYARLKMAGINPTALMTTGGWVPDFTNL
jgi:hypothetical protein